MSERTLALCLGLRGLPQPRVSPPPRGRVSWLYLVCGPCPPSPAATRSLLLCPRLGTAPPRGASRLLQAVPPCHFSFSQAVSARVPWTEFLGAASPQVSLAQCTPDPPTPSASLGPSEELAPGAGLDWLLVELCPRTWRLVTFLVTSLGLAVQLLLWPLAVSSKLQASIFPSSALSLHHRYRLKAS